MSTFSVFGFFSHLWFKMKLGHLAVFVYLAVHVGNGPLYVS